MVERVEDRVKGLAESGYDSMVVSEVDTVILKAQCGVMDGSISVSILPLSWKRARWGVRRKHCATNRKHRLLGITTGNTSEGY